MPTLLKQWPFDGALGTVDLNAHDAGWVYLGAGDRYRVAAGGYVQGKTIAEDGSVASHDYDVPVGTSVRLVVDLFREGVDMVGGGYTFSLYYRDAVRGTADQTDRLDLGVRRSSANTVQMAAVWVRATGGFPATELITSASLSMLGSTARRFIWDVEEFTGMVRQYAADFLTGANAVSLSAALGLDASLIAHGAGDRHAGFGNRGPSQGITGFRLYHMELYDLATAPPPAPGDPCSFLLEVFDDERVVPIWAVSTSPNHPFPYLEVVEDYAEQEIDVAKGAASIGTVGLTIIDKGPAGDQDGGFMMDKLATLAGRRGRLTHFDDAGAPVVVIDGPVSLPTMADYPAFRLQVQDTRETEQEVRLFDEVLPTVDVSEDEADTTPTTGGTDGEILWNTENH